MSISLTPVVWDPWQIDELEKHARISGCGPASLPVHVEIDTGMSRQGTSLSDLPGLLARFTADSPLATEAVMTHLYASDETESGATAAQLTALEQALVQISAHLPPGSTRPRWLSVGASAALLGGEAEPIRALAARAGLAPLMRLGLALYGLTPQFMPDFALERQPAELSAAYAQLRPVLTWKTRIVSVRDLAPGTHVGYNGTFVATEFMKVALVAVGYADGLDRRLGNRLHLLVRGKAAPLIGRISMDQSVVDITEVPGAAAGDELVIIGTQQEAAITAFDHADAAGTIPWEIFTRISSRVERTEVF